MLIPFFGDRFIFCRDQVENLEIFHLKKLQIPTDPIFECKLWFLFKIIEKNNVDALNRDLT